MSQRKILKDLNEYYLKNEKTETSNKLLNLCSKINKYKEQKMNEDEIFSIFEDKLFLLLLEDLIEKYST